MSESIDTETQRKHVEQLHKFNHVDNLALAGRAYLDHIDRLQAENQRLKLAALTADRESMGLEAENQRLEERHEAMADALVTEATKRHYLRDEATSVLQLMDGLAEQWGDEGVFRRCRDRLRAAVESAGGGDG